MKKLMSDEKPRTLEIKDGVLTLDLRDIEYEQGKHFWVKVKGFPGNPDEGDNHPEQLMIEYYEDVLKIHVWDKNGDHCFDYKPREEYGNVLNAPKEDLPLLIHTKDKDAKELLETRLRKH